MREGVRGWALGLAAALLAAHRTARAEPIVSLDGGRLRIEIDEHMRSRIVAKVDERVGGAEIPLGRFAPSEIVVVNGLPVRDFARAGAALQPLLDARGAGRRLTVRGERSGLRQQLDFTAYDDFPGFVFFEASYTNTATVPVRIDRWRSRHFLDARAGGGARAGAPAFWSYQSGSYPARPDWVRPLRVGFVQRNFMGMNASDYGGGTPVADVWRGDVGLAVGHVELAPQLVALPVAMRDRAQVEVGIEGEVDETLAPGARFTTPRLFLAVHRGDHFTTLATYRRFMIRQGVHFPPFPGAAYDPIWCGWGYDRGVTLAQMRGTLPKAAQLGFKWAVLDDGWQTAIGDWSPRPAKFPAGVADLKALTDEMRAAGLRPMLWWSPLALHPGAALAQAHPEYLLLGKDGKPQKISWWNAFTMCPAYAPVRAHTAALVKTFLGPWGFAGLKLDGQHLNAVPPCYNPAHHHADPRDSFTALPGLFALIAEAARQSQPPAAPPPVIELCPCGTGYSFFALPFTNLPAASDPESSWQVRSKGKTLKALLGAASPYFGDHVELSDGGDDFASTIGVGGVVGTQFTLPGLGPSQPRFQLTPAKEAGFRKWMAIAADKSLARGQYLGALYDIGFDRPEAHVIEKDGHLYYAFFAARFAGAIELRGLADRGYLVHDYESAAAPVPPASGFAPVSVHGPTARISVRFRKHLLLEAAPAP